VVVVGVPGTPPLLLLFDIDGTLVWRASEAHAEALHRAIHEVHGVDVRHRRTHVSPAGRTDGEIARLLLLDAGVSAAAIDEGADEVRFTVAEGPRNAPARDWLDRFTGAGAGASVSADRVREAATHPDVTIKEAAS